MHSLSELYVYTCEIVKKNEADLIYWKLWRKKHLESYSGTAYNYLISKFSFKVKDIS